MFSKVLRKLMVWPVSGARAPALAAVKVMVWLLPAPPGAPAL